MVLQLRQGLRQGGLRRGGLRPTGTLRDAILSTALPETLAHIAAVEAADGEQLETGVLAAMVKYADWRIPLGGACCLMAGARTLAGVLVPMVGPAPVAVNFVNGDYNRLQGLKGVNGSGKTIGTGFTIDTARQNDHHIAARVSIQRSALFRPLIADAANNILGGTGIYGVSPVEDARVHSALAGGVVVIPGFFAELGFKGASRNSPAEYVYTDGTTETTFARVSGTPVGAEMTVFDFPSGVNSSDVGITMYSVGPFINMTTFRLMSDALDAGLTAALA